MRKIRAICGMILLGLLLFGNPVQAQAAAGTVYSCVIHPTYSHPVTGVVEDAGGAASYTTGQGMVEGAVATTGILEVTTDGSYYLTVRFSLMDYSSSHDFSVQTVGDSTFSEVSATTTATGSDSNGATADFCIQVPSESCIVRISMTVDPMGRDVIFYLYPTDYTEGNTTDFVAAQVTEAAPQTSDTDKEKNAVTAVGATDTAGAVDTTGVTDATEVAGAADAAGITSAAGGLSLSTADNATDTAADSATESGAASEAAQITATMTDTEGVTGLGAGIWILILTTSMTISGLIVMLTGIAVVWQLKKKAHRWDGEADEQ